MVKVPVNYGLLLASFIVVLDIAYEAVQAIDFHF